MRRSSFPYNEQDTLPSWGWIAAVWLAILAGGWILLVMSEARDTRDAPIHFSQRPGVIPSGEPKGWLLDDEGFEASEFGR